jgi:hypothetical protein
MRRGPSSPQRQHSESPDKKKAKDNRNVFTRPKSFLAKVTGPRPLELKDIEQDPLSLNEGSKFREDFTYLLEQIERDLDTSLVFASEPGAPQNESYRNFIMHTMRQIGTRFAMKVNDALKLLEFLAPEAMCSFVLYCNARRHNPSTQRVSGLHLRACIFARDPPILDPSVETLRLLSVADQKKLLFLLEVCREAMSIDLPVETTEDERKVQFLAQALGTTDERILSDWGRVGMQGVKPQVQWAEALFSAIFDWVIDLINQSWKLPPVREDPADGCRITFTKVPSVEGTDFTAFSYFIAGEALTQRCIEMLPTAHGVRGSRGREPEAEEMEFLKDSVYPSISVGIFGQAGLLHFLTSGKRTENAIMTYIELLRDGDLQMRRFFGARMRDVLRLRAREGHLANFDLPGIANATDFDNFEIFDLKGDIPKWCELSKVKPDIPIDKMKEYKNTDVAFLPLTDVAHAGKTTQIVRAVNGISDVLRVVRGDLVVFHVPTDREPKPVMAIPSAVILLECYRDTVPYRRLVDFFRECGMVPQVPDHDASGKAIVREDDPMAVIADVLGTKRPTYEIVGNMVCFKPFLARVLWDRINEDLRLPADMYWHSWDPEGDRKLPRRWRSPSRYKAHADYESSLPPSPPLRARGNRMQPHDSVKEVLQNTPEKLGKDHEMHGIWPDVDLRFKNSPRDTHDASRLLFNTSVLMCSNELFSRGIQRAFDADQYYKKATADQIAKHEKEDAEASKREDPKQLVKQDARQLKAKAAASLRDFAEQDKSWSDNAAMRLDKNVILKLNKIRAIFKGKTARKTMAELQRMHIAAQKIQLAYLQLRSRRIAGVQCLIRFVRHHQLKKLLMEMKNVRKELAVFHNDNAKRAWRSNVRAPEGGGLQVLHIPGYIRRDQRSTIGREICRIVSAWCGVSQAIANDELVRIRRMDYSEDTTLLSLEVPPGVEDRIKVLHQTMDMPDSPLRHIIDVLNSQSKSSRQPVAVKHGAMSPNDYASKRAEKMLSHSASPIRRRAQSPGSELSPSPNRRGSQVMDEGMRRAGFNS